jgi:hypothetical protein
MTEDEWQTSRDGRQMLAFVQTATVPVRTRWLGWKAARRFRVSERKGRFVAAACCERVAELRPHLRELILLARRRAAGEDWLATPDTGEILRLLVDSELDIQDSNPASLSALTAVRGLFVRAEDALFEGVLEAAARARAGAFAASRSSGVYERHWHQALAAEQAAQADVVRDVIGNPFRREVIDPAWLTANDGAATRIAEGGTFADLPVLADALEDAGCTSRAILDHCRGPGPHVAGCWVVDLVFGKE